jgi:hypothetical protein
LKSAAAWRRVVGTFVFIWRHLHSCILRLTHRELTPLREELGWGTERRRFYRKVVRVSMPGSNFPPQRDSRICDCLRHAFALAVGQL